MMRVVLSIQEGKISSATLLRRLSTYSRRSNFYKAFREVGRVIRTFQLLRFLSDPQLRRRTVSIRKSCGRPERLPWSAHGCWVGNHSTSE